MNFHTPALLQEVIAALSIQEGMKYIDATLGGAGHTKEILNRGGVVLGIDQDTEALEHVSEDLKLEIENKTLTLVWGNFKDIGNIAKKAGFVKNAGILFDLGVSSHQLNSSHRGFSIRADERLDMRMDTNQKITAWDVINTYSKDELVDILLRFGEEEHAQIIAEKIVEIRSKQKIETTGELKKLIEGIVLKRGMIHPATKTFQAVRIEVNQELEVIKQALTNALDLLDANGRIAVISFHSLEDRIIKRTFDVWEKEMLGKTVTKKPIQAGYEEVLSNPRARSAKLRVFEKK